MVRQILTSIRGNWSNWRLTAGFSLRNLWPVGSVLSPTGPVVSLTTHGERVQTVHITLESIARGHLRPSRLILWVSDAALVASPPAAIRRLMRRGLEVHLTEDVGPHTKYWPSLGLADVCTRPLVTADDDVIYPPDWLARLWQAHQETPHQVVGYRARVIVCGQDEIHPYGTWPYCASSQGSVRHFVTGVAGAIYPPAFLTALRASGKQFLAVCPKADDIWLHAVALRNGFLVRQIDPRPQAFPSIPGTQAQALMHDNVGRGGNDRQIRAVYSMQDVRALNVQG